MRACRARYAYAREAENDADYAVPTPDHFLPLLYILGASRGESPYTFNNVRNLGSMALTGYAFGL